MFEFSFDQRSWTRQQILDTIARELLTSDDYRSFVPMPPEEQQAKIVQLLRAQCHLLLLDNLETITGSHLAIGQALSEPERTDLKEFLNQLNPGSSFVLLGSRAGEDWLNPGTFESNVHELQGLDPGARALMACAILRRIGQEALLGAAVLADPEQAASLDALQRLLRLLGGFPLAMEVVLPALANEPLQSVLAALERGDIDLGSGDPEDKTRSIIRCIDYAYSRLDADAQQLLACLAPFTGVFNTMYQDKYLEHLRRQDALQALPFDRWDEVMHAAAQWGLVTPEAHLPDLLRLQPTLPYFLRQRLSSLPELQTAIETAFREHCRGVACELDASLNSGDPRETLVAQFLARTEFENLYRALREALRVQEPIRALYALLLKHFAQTQEHGRVRALADEVMTGMTRYPETVLTGALSSDHVMAIIVQGTHRREDRQYLAAEDAYRQALQALRSASDLPAREHVDLSTTIYHELGMNAEQQRQWPQAEAHYRKALEIGALSGDDFNQADTYHQLGTVALAQRQWQQAEEHFKEALQMNVKFNAWYKQAQTYHELGILAQEQRQWVLAETHFGKALDIKIEFNDHYGQSSTHYQLGQVAYEQRQWPRAETHFRKALEMRIEFKDRYRQAGAYHSLGDVALEQGQWAQAEQHFERSLEIFIEFNDRYEQGGAYHQLGSLAERQSQWPQAEELFIQALEIFIEFNDRPRQAGAYIHLGNVACQQRQWPQAEAHYRKALEISIELDDRFRQGTMCHKLGAIAQELCQWPQAEALGLQAVALFVESQEEKCVLAALHALACLWLQTRSENLLFALTQLIGGTADEAVAAFEKLLEWGGTNAHAVSRPTGRV